MNVVGHLVSWFIQTSMNESCHNDHMKESCHTCQKVNFLTHIWMKYERVRWSSGSASHCLPASSFRLVYVCVCVLWVCAGVCVCVCVCVCIVIPTGMCTCTCTWTRTCTCKCIRVCEVYTCVCASVCHSECYVHVRLEVCVNVCTAVYCDSDWRVPTYLDLSVTCL